MRASIAETTDSIMFRAPRSGESISDGLRRGARRHTSEVEATAGVSNPIYGPGAAYVFTEPASGWANMTQTAKLTASDNAATSDFGDSVAIAGNTIMVGAPGESLGATGPGAACEFAEPAASWENMSQTNELAASDGTGSNDDFGGAVAISGNALLVGAGAATVGEIPDLDRELAAHLAFDVPLQGVVAAGGCLSFDSCIVTSIIVKSKCGELR